MRARFSLERCWDQVALFLRLGSLVLVGVFLAATTSRAQQSVPAQQTAWISTCSSTARTISLECALEQRASTANGQFAAGLTLRIPPETRAPVAMIQVPLGLFVPAGVTIDVDGKGSQTLPFQTCNVNGCFAGFPLAAETLDSMLKGRRLSVAYQYLDKRNVSVPISLTGFAEAYGRVK
jgi:invasion protein IalB